MYAEDIFLYPIIIIMAFCFVVVAVVDKVLKRLFRGF